MTLNRHEKGGVAEVGKGDGIRTKMKKRKESEMAKGETIK
jgi:hypothetical protein